MTVGETILKFTDYPFAYSFIGIIFGGIGFEFSQNHILFLGIAGTIGTLFTLADPIGRIIRKRIEQRLDKKFSNIEKKKEPTTIDFMKSSIKSRSISIEIDKMVGLWYFIIITITFTIAILLSTTLANKLTETLPVSIVYNSLCIQIISSLGSSIVLFILGCLAVIFWKELDDKIETAGHHQEAIGNEFVTENSVENMSRSVESGDWETAKLWWKKIKEEIKYKKGKRELIIKSADLVFSPLHRESIAFEQGVNFMIFSYRYPTFEHKEWDEITRNSYQSIIEDTELRYRIDSFYKLALDYSNKQGPLGRIVDDILYKHASDVFDKKDVSKIEYEIESPNGNGNAELFGCALFSTHPLDFYRVRGKLKHILVRSRDGNGNQVNSTFYDNILFDKMWDLVIKEIDLKDEIIKIRQMFEQVKTENSKLIKIYSEKIGMQWNV